ncbi:MAG: Ig-like domain-containing protein, partial [Bradyrhizobium sp.]
MNKFVPAGWSESASESIGFDLHSFSQFSHADAVTIPDAHLLFSGDYARSGNDLIISDHVQRFVVSNYFSGEKRPMLVSPEGAPFDSRIVEALTGHVAYAQAGAAVPGAKVVGHVVKMTGSASIVRNGVAIVVNTGDTLYQNDVVQTGSNSTVGLVLDDGTAFNLSANARFMLNDFLYDPNSTSNHSLVSLIQGAATFVAGQIAPTGNMEVSTPISVVGIRGTAVILDINSIDGQVSISVADQQDGQVHSVQVFKCTPTGVQGVCTAGDPIGTVASNGSTLRLTPAPNFQVTTEEASKTPTQVTQEFSSFQQVLGTYDAGKQLYPNLPQHTENTNQNNNTNTGTTKTALGSTPAQPLEPTSTSVFADVRNTEGAVGGSLVPAALPIDFGASAGAVSGTPTSQSSNITPLILVVKAGEPIAISSAGGTTNQTGQTISGSVDAAFIGTTVTLFDTYNGVTTPVGTTTVGNGGVWGLTVTLRGDGSHSLVAQDSTANSTSTPVVFTLETTAPTVAITSPGGPANQATQTISGTVVAAAGEAAVGSTVTLFDTVNGVTTQVGAATVGSGGDWSAKVTLSGIGTHSIVAQDTDAAGNTGTSAPVTFTVPTTGPTVTTLTYVTSNGNDLDAGQTVTFTLTASEALTIANGAALTLSNNATAVYNSSSGKFVYTVASGQDTADLKVTGYSGAITDAAGNALVASGVTLDTGVQIDTLAPTGGTPALTTASDSGTSHTDNITDVTNPTFTVALNPTVAVGDTVQLLLGGSALAHPVSHTITSTDITNNSVSLTVTAGDLGSDGSKSITAQFTDAAGNTSTTAADVITLDTTAPTV